MQIDDSQDNGDKHSFSYNVLDEEAAKISSIILAVQQKCLTADPVRVAHELLDWADVLAQNGKSAEAEFLYLHAINLCQHKQTGQYPVVFTGLREFALSLIARTSTVVEMRPAAVVEPDITIETNAA